MYAWFSVKKRRWQAKGPINLFINMFIKLKMIDRFDD